MKKKQYYFLGGLPRSGSTLLCAILGQNPEVHTEGNSGLAQFMWENHLVRYNSAKQFLDANKKQYIAENIIKALPDLYYSNTDKPKVVDKCRPWPLPANMDLIKTYITTEPKIVVLTRPIADILRSFLSLHAENNALTNETLSHYLHPGSDPIMRSIEAVIHAKNSKDPNTYLFITYDDLVNQTEITVRKIYDFFGWEWFAHDFNHVDNSCQEDDSVYGLMGQHDVRPKIEKRKVKFDLPQDVIDYCSIIDGRISI